MSMGKLQQMNRLRDRHLVILNSYDDEHIDEIALQIGKAILDDSQKSNSSRVENSARKIIDNSVTMRRILQSSDACRTVLIKIQPIFLPRNR